MECGKQVQRGEPGLLGMSVSEIKTLLKSVRISDEGLRQNLCERAQNAIQEGILVERGNTVVKNTGSPRSRSVSRSPKSVTKSLSKRSNRSPSRSASKSPSRSSSKSPSRSSSKSSSRSPYSFVATPSSGTSSSSSSKSQSLAKQYMSSSKRSPKGKESASSSPYNLFASSSKSPRSGSSGRSSKRSSRSKSSSRASSSSSKSAYPQTQNPVAGGTKEIQNDLQKCGYYDFISKLGSGTQAMVVKVRDVKNKEYYAAKVMPVVIDDDDFTIGDNGLSEVNYSFILDHPNIVKARDFVVCDNNAYLVLDLADSDLQSLLDKTIVPIDDKIRYIFDLAGAASYIRRSDLIHCDLKPPNVLLKNGNVMISDLGLLRPIENTRPNCQTYIYRAPEVIQHTTPLAGYKEAFGAKKVLKWLLRENLAEIWSLGVLFLDILYNTTFLFLDGRIARNKMIKEHITENPKLDATDALINILALTGLKGKFEKETVYSIITEVFGDLEGDADDLLQLVCDKLLVVDQDDREEGFIDFINSDFFDSHGYIYDPVDSFTYPKINKMYTPNKIATPKNVAMIVDWMFEIHDQNQCSLITTMNAVDYFIQRSHIEEFAPDVDSLGDFAVTVMWMMDCMYYSGTEYLGLEDFAQHAQISTQDAAEIVKKIIRYETGQNRQGKGFMMFDSLYFRLSSLQLQIRGARLMKDTTSYIKYESVEKVTDHLRATEAPQDASHRLPRDNEYHQIV